MERPQIAELCGTQGDVSDRPSELYHVSEVPGVRLFEPRAPKPGEEPVVWAIDADHLANYLLPRECPRVTFFVDVDTTPDDAERLLLGSAAKKVVAIECGWLSRAASAQLVRYRFAPDGFELQDRIAGYYVSRKPVVPMDETLLGDLLGELITAGVELRVLPSLWELRERVIHSTLGFSIIRMRSAAPPERGYAAYHPLDA